MTSYQDALDAIEANRGAYLNPFLVQCNAYKHRTNNAEVFAEMQAEIDRLFYPHFISYHEDAEFIEKLIRLTMSNNILEVGMFSGFTTLHMLRAVLPFGHVTGIDNQKVYTSFLDRFYNFKFVQGDSINAIMGLGQQIFDVVYVDSDHSGDHTRKELSALWGVTRPGSIFVFHDCAPGSEIHALLQDCPGLNGLILPSADRLDVPKDQLPHLGVFIRQ
jgi:predicted O-methyltransferase YrrM